MTPPAPIRCLATVAAAALLAAVLLPAARAAAAEPGALRALLESRAPAVVTVEAVVRTEFQMGGQGEDQEANLDMVGTIVHPEGLILVWNSLISSSRLSAMMELMGGAGGAPGEFGIDMTPLSFQVRLPGSDEQVEAFLAASDPQLDLAFLQLAETPAEPLPYVDLSAAAEARVGEELYAVNRLSASFAYAPFLETGRVVGDLVKPRPAWIFQGDFEAMGLPVFDADGRPVGVISTVLSSVATERAAATMQGMGNMLNTGDGMTMGPLGVFLLPAPAVARAVERSLERARELQRERAEAAAEEAAEGEAEAPQEDSAQEDSPEEAGSGEEGGGEEGRGR